MALFRYFGWAIAVTFGGLIGSAWLGYFYGGVEGLVKFAIIGAVLAVLEISLSFDNAIVNANKLKDMTPVWRQRFLTWGILIAVFGMRIVFPLLIVVVAANIGPVAAIELAATDPQGYAAIIDGAHLSIAAFGGTFLFMVALSFFVDSEKDVHWFGFAEKLLAGAGGVEGLKIAMGVATMLGFALFLPAELLSTFLLSGVFGLLVFLLVEALGHVLDKADAAMGMAARGGVGAFLYLEVIDASFSFDGVIGAFALTQNLFLIAIGLGIGAMYVRSMTIMLVEKNTLAAFRYLEHGAFWSILILSLVMFAQSFVHISEIFTGLFGAFLIGAALVSSILWNRKNPAVDDDGVDKPAA
jgi:uncharacterized protein